MKTNKLPITIFQPTLLMTRMNELRISQFDLIWCKHIDKTELFQNFKGYYFIIKHKYLGLIIRLIQKVVKNNIIVSDIDARAIIYEMNLSNIESLFKVERILKCAN